MPEGRRNGYGNPHLSGRIGIKDRSAHVVRRPIRPHIRRGIDGFALPTAHPQNKQRLGDGSAGHKLKPQGQQSPRLVHDIKPALPRQSRSHVLLRPKVQKKTRVQRRRLAKQNPMSFLLVSMAAMVFIGGATVSYLGWKTNKQAAAQVEVLSSTTEDQQEGEIPAEDDITPDILASYRVAPDMPRYIKIPRLNVDARIKRLDIKPNGMLSSPANVNDAGWYDGSSKPGENGAVLIDGHVHGPKKPGVFYRLNNLKQGDTVEIERGDGKNFTYQVVHTESVDQDNVDMAKALTSIEPGKQGLNIITCTGRYDIKTNKYEQRLVVYLVQQ